MRKFEEPMFKVILASTQDVITTSILDGEIDNKKISVADIVGTGDYVEDDLFV